MPVITSLKKKGRAFLMRTDKSGEYQRIHPDIVAEYSLFEGKTLSNETLKTVISENNFRTAWDSALRMLSRRAHCVRELRNKLIRKGTANTVADRVISECRRLELLNDAKFAKEYIQELKESGCALRMIRAKLAKKGVPQEIQDAELEHSFLNDDEIEAAITALKKKLPHLKREKDPRKHREKLFRFMVSRGFSFETIETAREKLEAQQGEET